MSTLKNLVDETTNIKDEIIACYSNLKNNLINKGVEVLEEDKILDLINKIENLNSLKFASGTMTVSSGNKVDVTLTGLNFKPHLVIMNRSTVYGGAGLYGATICIGEIADNFPANYMFIVDSSNYLDVTAIDGKNYYMNYGGFRLRYYKSMGVATNCNWVAIGI